MVARLHGRLGVVFERALLVALTGAGCSTKGADVTPPRTEQGGVDASVADASHAADGGEEAGPPDRCAPTPLSPNPPDTCGDYMRFPCGLPLGFTIRPGCYLGISD